MPLPSWEQFSREQRLERELKRARDERDQANWFAVVMAALALVSVMLAGAAWFFVCV